MEEGIFDMTLNNDVMCTTRPDYSFSGTSDLASGSCSAIVDVVAGKFNLKHIINTL